MLAGIRDTLLLYDPCFTRLIFASRAVLGLAAVAIIGWLLTRETGQDLSGVLLGVAGAQFTLLLAREPSRVTRITTSFLMIPSYWLGLIIVHVVADQPALQIVILPLMVGLGFWLKSSRSRLATMMMAAAWIFMFTIYFGAQDGLLTWHLAAVSVSILIMMAVRFLIWADDKPLSLSLILRSHQLILTGAAHLAAKSNARADLLGWFHKAMVPVIQSLATHPKLDDSSQARLLDQRTAFEIELLGAPASEAEISRILTEKPDVTRADRVTREAVQKDVAEFQRVDVAENAARFSEKWMHSSHRRAIQVTAAVMPAALAGFLISPERWPWAVLVAMFMFFGTENSGRLLSKGVQNVIGVVVGFALAIVLSSILPPIPWLEWATIMALTFLAFYFIPVNYAAGMAAVTALIGQALSLGGGDIGMLLGLRLIEVLAGAAFGIFAGLFVMPERASDNVRRACANLLNDAANVLDPGKTGPDTARLRENLAAAYTAADFGRLAGLLIDGAGMRAALIEMAQLQNLIELYRSRTSQTNQQIPNHYLNELAGQCRTVAEQVVDRRKEVLVPISWPEGGGNEFGILAAIDASVRSIAKQS